MLSYKEFIVEKMGILFSLEPLADEILKTIKEKGVYYYEGDYIGHQIKLKVFIDKNLESSNKEDSEGYLDTIDIHTSRFEIGISKELHKSTLVHELKHMDRELRRDYKDDTSEKVNNCIKGISRKYGHLFYKSSIDQFILIFYLCNHNEFEAYYHSIYYELKNRIGDITDKKMIKGFLDNLFKNQVIINLYKELSKDVPFDVKQYFNNDSDCEYFLNEFFKYLNVGNHDREGLIIPKENTIKSIFKKIGRFFISVNHGKNFEINVKIINNLVNRISCKNYYKLHRLYSLFL